MDIPSGGIIGLLRILFKPLADFFEKLLYYRAYEISTLYHSHREAFGTRPNKLVDGVDFKILWEPYHLRRRLTTPMIWLRATDGMRFSKIALTVTALNNKIRFQDHIVLFDINETPTQAALPSIPFRSLKFLGNQVFTPYDYIKVETKALHDDNDKELHIPQSQQKMLCPLDRLEVALGLERGYIEKWGEIFNLEFIEMEIKEEKIRLTGPMFASLKPAHQLRKRLFSVGWIAKTIFWSKNIVFAKQLSTAFAKYLEDHGKQKKWEQEHLQRDLQL